MMAKDDDDHDNYNLQDSVIDSKDSEVDAVDDKFEDCFYGHEVRVAEVRALWSKPGRGHVGDHMGGACYRM
jgi:hypothetical protein